MSRQNVEIVRRLYDAYLRGDAATALAAFDPDIEWDATHHPDGRVYRGYDGIQQFLREWQDLWESTWSQPERFLEAGDEVVVLTREMTRLKGSGLEVTERHAEI
jgi:ketosteroid isomerase-like protein